MNDSKGNHFIDPYGKCKLHCKMWWCNKNGQCWLDFSSKEKPIQFIKRDLKLKIKRATKCNRTISKGKREKVYKRDCYKCVSCGSGENITIDHIKPVSKGGTNKIDNLQTMCFPCNQKKGDKE
jgi:5-methylcytosine-specific restriction endonuclease McrA